MWSSANLHGIQLLVKFKMLESPVDRPTLRSPHARLQKPATSSVWLLYPDQPGDPARGEIFASMSKILRASLFTLASVHG